MESEDGETFVKNLAHFIRTHEKALANALQSQRHSSKNGQNTNSSDGTSTPVTTHPSSSAKSSTSNAFASMLSLGSLNSSSHNSKAARISLTSHHLYYLLSKVEELGVQVGPMGVRLENIHTEASPANYVSFLNQAHRSTVRSDRDSIHSVSSMRSVMSSMGSFWSGFGLRSSNAAAKTEKAKAQFETDLKYLYSAFTKIPSLRLSPDRNAHLIAGYEEFPFDTAVPLLAFKNVGNLEITDMDFRHFFGWDRLAEQLRTLTLKRAQLDDPLEVLVSVVLDDVEKRRRRSSKAQASHSLAWPTSPSMRFADPAKPSSTPTSPAIDEAMSQSISPKQKHRSLDERDHHLKTHRPGTGNTSPARSRSNSRPETSQRYSRGAASSINRSGSGSSDSSGQSSVPIKKGSYSNLLNVTILPPSKWRFLRNLNLSDNSLTTLNAASLAPVAHTLQSLDLSSNLFDEIPESISTLHALRYLSMGNCMIESLNSLRRQSFPAISALNLRSNHLSNLVGVEQLPALRRLDIRDNRIRDPMEVARLTESPDFCELWVSKNPFTKTHANYRITIFNVFRDTPGYSEDLIVDASGPGYNERRQLREWAARSDRPASKPSTAEKKAAAQQQLEVPPPVTSERIPHNITAAQSAPIIEAPNTHEHTLPGSGRSKKGARRRIVDLAQASVTTHASQNSPRPSSELGPNPRASSDSSTQNKTEHPPPPSETPRSNLSGNTNPTSPNSKSPLVPSTKLSALGQQLAIELQRSSTEGEAYRQKMEALKNEVGSNWLSVLSEQNWNESKSKRQAPALPRAGLGAHDQMPLRTSSQGIVSGGRTLG